METEARASSEPEIAHDDVISTGMRRAMDRGSWIRQMFEEGNRLRREVGPDNVFDFTLGNPSVPPPAEFHRALAKVVEESRPLDHRYMTNVGLESTRDFLAGTLRERHGDGITADHIVMTCGAAGALNIFFKSVLDAGDEVLVPKPYFPEYLFYVENHGGRPVAVDSGEGFQLDLDRIHESLGERTRAVIVNTPNNPSGVVYGEASVHELGRIIEEHADRIGRPVFMVLDEPYRRIRYVDEPHPSAIRACRYGVVATSYSKDLGLAGERIGYLVVNPRMPGGEELYAALANANRILGFVNAPALMQRVLPLVADSMVDVDEYRRNRDLLYPALCEAGYDVPHPGGAFFLFPRVPGDDDIEFCRKLRGMNVLCVPGRGFGTPGHIRISYAVPPSVIERAIPLFRAALK